MAPEGPPAPCIILVPAEEDPAAVDALRRLVAVLTSAAAESALAPAPPRHRPDPPHLPPLPSPSSPAPFMPLAAAVCIEQEQLVAQCLGAPTPPESSAPPCPLLPLFIEPPKSQQAAPRPLHLRHVPAASVARKTSAAPCFL
ncbi:vegetative cell wall protein gp1-like [Triticum dicoccoides]|uniref:vegetative cell wall protein gp1-like n=1 Tax=Triticum dicoccoides TaxID=85692 RepID=UPI001890C98D|nr:vegetative cell wall protein gp1-like [Triticum dicoccoides]